MAGSAAHGGPKYNPRSAVQRGGTRQPFLHDAATGSAELDLLTNAVYSELQRHREPVRQSLGGESPTAAEQSDLLTVMCGRLRSLEKTAGQLRSELAAKEKEVLQLQRELEAAKSSPRAAEEAEVLRAQNTRLAVQVVQMTQFLREHGLEWVGTGRDSPLLGQRGSAPQSSSTSPKSDAQPARCGRRSQSRQGSVSALAAMGGDSWAAATVPQALPPAPAPYFAVEVLKQRVAELNLVVGERRIVAEGRRLGDGAAVHRFTDPDTIPIAVFSDGIVVNGGPFRPYSWTLARAFLDDILEGYFPYEYKERYPDGMLMAVRDRTSERFTDARTAGQAPRTVHDEEGYRALTKGEFLSRLPSQVVTRSGHIVDVRADVGEFMGGKEPEAAASTVTDAPQTAAIQVRIVGGGKLTAHLPHSATVGELRSLVAARLPAAQHGRHFELLTAFPRRTYADDAQTLEAAGLTPNAALLMRIAE
eukprot:TRINITY_DN21410_c0_g2_i1.p1 TRINITY_DN21410_c0_g2~~TRINITY_DN21410_c0_g2_i1.p1  ORF type:complete len:496 (+),score=206.35 TRINITY_DN21410_c0_g2_i1:65-1489(+)